MNEADKTLMEILVPLSTLIVLAEKVILVTLDTLICPVYLWNDIVISVILLIFYIYLSNKAICRI